MIRVRDLNNLDEAHYELRGHSGGIKCIDISEKGVIASGSNDNNVKLWDLFTGKFCRTLRGHSLEINAVNFIKNSTWLLTGSEDNMFRVWDIANGERLRVFKGHDGATITSISSIYIPGFVPPLAIIGGTERESYISQLMNPLEVWRLDTAELVARCTGHRDEVAALATYCERSEDCIRCEVFSGGVDKLLRIWDFTPFLSNYMSELENIDDMLSLEDSSLNSGTISKLADEEDTFA